MPVGDGSVEHAHVDVVVADGAHVGEGVVVVEVSTFRLYWHRVGARWSSVNTFFHIPE